MYSNASTTNVMSPILESFFIDIAASSRWKTPLYQIQTANSTRNCNCSVLRATGREVKRKFRDSTLQSFQPRHQPSYRPMIPESARAEFWPSTTNVPENSGACRLCSQGAQGSRSFLESI